MSTSAPVEAVASGAVVVTVPTSPEVLASAVVDASGGPVVTIPIAPVETPSPVAEPSAAVMPTVAMAPVASPLLEVSAVIVTSCPTKFREPCVNVRPSLRATAWPLNDRAPAVMVVPSPMLSVWPLRAKDPAATPRAAAIARPVSVSEPIVSIGRVSPDTPGVSVRSCPAKASAPAVIVVPSPTATALPVSVRSPSVSGVSA